MNTTAARRARRRAEDVLAYRRWAAAPATAEIPSPTVISDPRIHRHEARRAERIISSAVTPTLRPAVV